MSVCLFVCLFVCVFVCLHVLFVCFFVCLFVCLFRIPSDCQTARIQIRPGVFHLFVYIGHQQAEKGATSEKEQN